MPILEFSNCKDQPTTYDFSELPICRIAGMYLALRELILSDTAAVEQTTAAVNFCRPFDSLLIALNFLHAHQEELELNEQLSYATVDDIKTSLRDVAGTMSKLRIAIKEGKFPDIFSAENIYLFENIDKDLEKIQRIASEGQLEVIDKNNPRVENLNLLLQLRDFLNIFFDTDKKPSLSMAGSAVETMREATRIGAYSIGSLFSAVARNIGLTEQTEDATKWLISWNDKHKPPQLEEPPKPTNRRQ